MMISTLRSPNRVSEGGEGLWPTKPSSTERMPAIPCKLKAIIDSSASLLVIDKLPLAKLQFYADSLFLCKFACLSATDS